MITLSRADIVTLMQKGAYMYHNIHQWKIYGEWNPNGLPVSNEMVKKLKGDGLIVQDTFICKLTDAGKAWQGGE